MEKLPTHLKAENLEATLERWLLPEVGSSHVVGLAEKVPETEDKVQVVEEEIVAEKVTLSELEEIREGAYEEGFALGKQDGYQFGLNEGQQKGHAEGLAKGESEVQARIGQLISAIDDLALPLDQKHSDLARWITALSIKVAESVIQREVSTDSGVVNASLSQALSELPEASTNVIIRLNPEDAANVSEAMRLQRSQWQVVEDAAIAQGGCLIESDNTRIDNSLEYQIEQVSNAFTSHLTVLLANERSDES